MIGSAITGRGVSQHGVPELGVPAPILPTLPGPELLLTELDAGLDVTAVAGGKT